jgi:tryptophanyl-tRNA synthetase
MELHWILSCFTSKGLMNRAHAYKAMVDRNKKEGLDVDTGVNMGLYTYPILMAADILLFQTDLVPVGKDQIQHVEITCDIAENFNRTYGETFTLPRYLVKQESAIVPGLDGRKMSKSYGNTIPLFASSKELQKLIMKIKTDSTPPDSPKDPNTSTLFVLYREFASPEQVEEMRRKYRAGIGWGQVKQELFEVIDGALREPREKYYAYLEQPEELDRILKEGAERAREKARETLKIVKRRIGCF